MEAYFKRDFSKAHRHFHEVCMLSNGTPYARPQSCCAVLCLALLASTLTIFAPLLTADLDPAAAILRTRCEQFILQPPPEDWNGCDVLKSKEY